MTADEEWYETFICSSCGDTVTRMRGNYDMPICAECRMWEAIDPSGKLKQQRTIGAGSTSKGRDAQTIKE